MRPVVTTAVDNPGSLPYGHAGRFQNTHIHRLQDLCACFFSWPSSVLQEEFSKAQIWDAVLLRRLLDNIAFRQSMPLENQQVEYPADGTRSFMLQGMMYTEVLLHPLLLVREKCREATDDDIWSAVPACVPHRVLVQVEQALVNSLLPAHVSSKQKAVPIVDLTLDRDSDDMVTHQRYT